MFQKPYIEDVITDETPMPTAHKVVQEIMKLAGDENWGTRRQQVNNSQGNPLVNSLKKND